MGACVGLYLWARSDWATSPSTTPGALFISGGAVLGGLVAGCRQDAFWSDVGEAFDALLQASLVGLGEAGQEARTKREIPRRVAVRGEKPGQAADHRCAWIDPR